MNKSAVRENEQDEYDRYEMMLAGAKPKPTQNVTVKFVSYPNLRDDGGCILARDYIDMEKCAYVIQACNSHAALVAALELALSAGKAFMLQPNQQRFTQEALDQFEAALKLAGAEVITGRDDGGYRDD